MRASAALMVVSCLLPCSGSLGHTLPDPAPEPDLAAIRVIDIPAQPLDDALRRLAQLTGFQLLYAPSLVRELSSVAIRGHMAPREALARMLHGTGLEVIDTGPGAAALRRPAAVAEDGAIAPMSILVTARRFSEPLFAVPIAITAVGAAALRRHGADAVDGMLRDVPGVSVQQGNAGLVNISIRGIGTSLGGNANGYYLDDLPFTGVTVPIAPDVRLWDLERVEVLRGPQGTLFGEGSMGGTVRILTNPARADRVEFASRAGVRHTAGGAAGHSLATMVNLPLAPDRLALRIAATSEREGGWIDEQAAGRRDLNSVATDTARLRLRYQPSDALQLNATYWTYRGERPLQNWALDSGAASRAMDYRSAMEYTLMGLSASHDLGPVTAFYSHTRNRFVLPQRGNVLGADSDLMIAIDVAASEVRLASATTAPWRWTVGLYQRSANRNDRIDAPAYRLANTSHTGSLARSVYGDLAYTFPGIALEASLGLRYFRDRLTGHDVVSGTAGRDSDSRFHRTSPRLALAWRRNDRQQTYISASKGFRSGQNQVSGYERIAAANDVVLPAVIKPDSLWTYELGTKLSVPEHGIAAELALYHSNWKDVAVRIPLGASGFNGLVSSGGIATDGIDASISLAPGHGFSATLAAGLVRSRYAAGVAGTGIQAGSRVDGVPDLTLAASTEYRFAAGRGWDALLRAAITHSGAQPNTTFPQFANGDALTNASASASISKGPWTLTFSADNLLNERGASSYRSAVASDDDVELVAARLRPRSVGLQLHYAIAY